MIVREEILMTKSTRNVGKIWTKDDISQLRKLAKENRRLRIIGLKLGRSPYAIRTKASEKGISLKRTSSLHRLSEGMKSAAPAHFLKFQYRLFLKQPILIRRLARL